MTSPETSLPFTLFLLSGADLHDIDILLSGRSIHSLPGYRCYAQGHRNNSSRKRRINKNDMSIMLAILNALSSTKEGNNSF